MRKQEGGATYCTFTINSSSFSNEPTSIFHWKLHNESLAPSQALCYHQTSRDFFRHSEQGPRDNRNDDLAGLWTVCRQQPLSSSRDIHTDIAAITKSNLFGFTLHLNPQVHHSRRTVAHSETDKTGHLMI